MMGLLDLDVPKGCDDVCVFMYRCVCVLAQCVHLCRGCDDVCVFMYV